jgi:hypothetical protein
MITRKQVNRPKIIISLRNGRNKAREKIVNDFFFLVCIIVTILFGKKVMQFLHGNLFGC